MDFVLARVAGTAFGFGLIGLAISAAIKAARKLDRWPKWPVILFTSLGALSALGLALGPHQTSN